MHDGPKRRRRLLSLGGGALALFLLALVPAWAGAAGPVVGDTWASRVEARSARLSAEIDPQGSPTSGYFEYASEADFLAKGFAGARKVNLNSIGSGSGFITVLFPTIAGLEPDTTYLYRLTATNGGGTTVAPPTPPYHLLRTQPLGGGQALLDDRGWEMVSPIDKNGGQVDQPGVIAGGGVLQAASQGSLITYSSSSSFAGGQGAPPASQYLATRTSSGWDTRNLTVPIFSGSYDNAEGGAPYRVFSGDLARGLLLNGKSCRGDVTSGCPVANPTLSGTGAPAGYQDYYLRDNGSGSFESLLDSGDIGGLGLDPADFELRFAGASPDLTHVVLVTCSKLSVAATDGCGGSGDNLYIWSPGGAPVLLNGALPGASLAAQSGAVSTNGDRVYFYRGGDLYLNDGGTIKQVDADAGGAGTFEIASADGSLAYFTVGAHIYRYSSSADAATDITHSGGVQGVLGAASDGSHLYYLNGSGLRLCTAADAAADCDAASTKVADDADAANYPPATGTARVTANGATLLFVATTPLSDSSGHTFDNTDLVTGDLDSQVYIYDAGGETLTCASCNPTNERPIGPSTIPGAIANGAGPFATVSYKPRVLSTNGKRVFFDSDDALVLTDTNSASGTGAGIGDAYQWEAQGEGSCSAAGGCQALVSSGRDAGGARFIDASASGDDAFFLTGAALVSIDPGSVDLYDSRVGGGFPDPPIPIPCEGDTCQVLPPEPTDPTLTTLLEGLGNPRVHYTRYKHHFKRPHREKHHKRHAHKRRGRPGGRR
jgi:hypothetical protein